MKNEILPSILLSIAGMFLLCVIYPGIIWGVAQFAPGHGEGKTITANGHTYYSNIAQKFTADKYFWSRPSAVDYNAAGSGGSNKGPSNPDFLKQVSDRTDTLIAHDPSLQRGTIPVELVTASGSGLDPDLSLAGALAQINRIARARGISPAAVESIVRADIQHPLLGILGPGSVNVLRLNLDLDRPFN
jgi:potassium-transporting ATPase KdpC subunit